MENMNEERRKQLDQALRKHTDGEERNLQGKPYDFVKTLTETNRRYPELSIPNLRYIFINKNSRFRDIEFHTHSYIEMGYIYSGRITEYIENHTFELHRGQIVIIDGNTAHGIGYAGEEDIMVNFVIPFDFFHQLLGRVHTDNVLVRFFLNALNEQNSECNYLIFNTDGIDRVEDLILECIYEAWFPTENINEIISSLVSSIIFSIMPGLDTEISYRSLGSSSETIVKALSFINDNYQTCSLSSTADHLGIHPSYLSGLLKEKTGRKFSEIVTARKMQDIVHKLIDTNDPIDVIAHASGYQNLTHFYHKFKELYHCTPKQMRSEKEVHGI
jgi:AraC-like DNA-binding protein